MIEWFETKIDVIFLSYVTSLSESADDLLVLDFPGDVFLDFSGEDDQVRPAESLRHLAVLSDDVQISCFESLLPSSAKRFVELHHAQQLAQADLRQREFGLEQIAIGVERVAR
jgi:hypothetical protein